MQVPAFFEDYDTLAVKLTRNYVINMNLFVAFVAYMKLGTTLVPR